MRRILLLALCAACGGPRGGAEEPEATREEEIPLPPLPWVTPTSPAADHVVESPSVMLRGATVMTASGDILENGSVLFEDGRIVAVGQGIPVPEGCEVVDASGRWITPGLIDTHSHVGVYPSPGAAAHADGNEATSPTTPQVDASDSFWPQDPAIPRLLAAGVTTIQVLPGSANLIGGRGFTVHLVPQRSAEEMHFPGAPDGMKMACGENPKRVYGERHSAPSTRMGNVAGYRAAFQGAAEYRIAWRTWQEQWRGWRRKRIAFERARDAGTADAGEQESRYGVAVDAGPTKAPAPEDPGPEPPPPGRDFGKDALVGVMEGTVLVQNHCYRADEMLRMIELGREFGFRIRSFHHAVEAYKIRDVLAREEVAVSTWSDWWGFKLEAYDSVLENLALLAEAGARGVLHSDSPMYVQRFNQEAAKAMFDGRAARIDIPENTALRWITANPAWVLGIHERTGTLEPGKVADVVVWSGSPWSVYTRVDQTWIDGRLAYDRAHPERTPRTDFEVGLGVDP